MTSMVILIKKDLKPKLVHYYGITIDVIEQALAISKIYYWMTCHCVRGENHVSLALRHMAYKLELCTSATYVWYLTSFFGDKQKVNFVGVVDLMVFDAKSHILS